MNGRKARQRAAEHRRKVESALKEIRAAQPRLVAQNDDVEMWHRGPAVLVVPVLRDDYPPELKAAVQTRRRASLELECPCGVEVRVTEGGQAAVRHAVDCPASDEVLSRLAAEAGQEVRRVDG
ncbi:hypothetical protein [Streptomyces mangrovi]|uniref:hypothetical protein n=1 Tax=Streptomyces mangrovi TaxID=1206892 RepID=UPI00399D396B